MIRCLTVLMQQPFRECFSWPFCGVCAGKFNELVYNYPIRIPERFSLVIRSLLTQEGICLTLEPNFKFLEVQLRPLVRVTSSNLLKPRLKSKL